MAEGQQQESNLTVLLALAANVGIAIAKMAAALEEAGLVIVTDEDELLCAKDIGRITVYEILDIARNQRSSIRSRNRSSRIGFFVPEQWQRLSAYARRRRVNAQAACPVDHRAAGMRRRPANLRAAIQARIGRVCAHPFAAAPSS